MNIVEKRAIHEHMAHREETADHYYNVGQITKKSSRGHQLLKKSLGLDTSVATRTKSGSVSANSTPPKDADSEPSVNVEGLSSNHMAIIEMLFSSQIISHAPIMLDVVRNTIAEHVDLRAFGNNSRMVKKIYDKVCYLDKRKRRTWYCHRMTLTHLQAKQKRGLTLLMKPHLSLSQPRAQKQNGIKKMKNLLKSYFQSILCAQTKKP